MIFQPFLATYRGGLGCLLHPALKKGGFFLTRMVPSKGLDLMVVPVGKVKDLEDSVHRLTI